MYPALAIAICTHDRAEDVWNCLALLHPQVDSSAAEILVVDSGSSPAHAMRLADVAAAFSGVRLIRVDQPGLSRARNAALAATESAWIAFLDDDALPDPDWLHHARRLTADAGPSCGVIGGTVQPVFPKGQQPVLGRRWQQLLSLVEQPQEAFAAKDAAVCGANVLYRRACLVECGGFPLSLGRIGESLLSGEEKLVGEVALRRGWTIGRSDRLRAGHRISAERIERRWAVRRAYWDGLSDQRIRGMLGDTPSRVELAGLLLRLIVLAAAYPFRPVQQEFFLRFWYTLGRLRELRTRLGPRTLAVD